MPEKETINLCVLADNLDAQRKEHLRILLLNDPRVNLVTYVKDADFAVCDTIRLKQRPKLPKNLKLIVLSPSDLWVTNMGLREEDAAWRQHVKDQKCKLFYFVVETEPMDARGDKSEWVRKKLYPGDDDIVVLPMPMGYISGSKMNINYPDNDSSTFFRHNFESNPRLYSYDWCFIATESCDDRTAIKQKLEDRNSGFMSVNPPRLNQVKTKEDIKKRMENIHADNKPVPYRKYMEIHRKSRVAISCNGLGMWCFKDVEMLSRNCFVLRQYHRNLGLNPLSPQDGKHWVVFKNDELDEKLNYYIQNHEERERINDAGHHYIKEAITEKWARSYVDAFLLYLSSGDNNAFGNLRLGG